jgi:hypothetical protein
VVFTSGQPERLTLGGSVFHQLKITIWRDKGNLSARIKLSQLDTLVEGQVINGDG